MSEKLTDFETAFRWRELDEGRYDGLMDPITFESRMQWRRDMRESTRLISWLTNFTITLVGACLFALCVIGVVWGVL